MSTTDTRNEINASIQQLKDDKEKIQIYIEETSMPDIIKKVLTEEVESLEDAINSLLYALELYYETSCTKCGRVMKTEQPLHEQDYVCGGCFNAVRRT